MATHNHNTEKRAGQNRSVSCRTRRKLSRIGNIAGGVLVSGLLVISCGSSKFINNNQSNIAAYGDTMTKPKYYKKPTEKPYGKKALEDKKKIEKWEKETLVIYQEQSAFMDMEKNMIDMLKERIEAKSLVEELPSILKNLNKDQKRLFFTLASTMMEDPKKLSVFVQRAILMEEMLRTGAELSTVLGFDKDLMLEPIKGDTKAAKAYNKVVEEMEDDALSQAMLLAFLGMESQAKKSIPAISFVEKHYVDEPIDKDVLKIVSKAIPSVLKVLEKEQKTSLEKFKELMDKDTGLLDDRERTIFLNVMSRLNDIERKYAISFADSIYEAVKDPQTIGLVYDAEMEMLRGMWGFPFQEMMDSVLERAEAGRNYTTAEKMMIATLYHYSFLEAFQVNPPMGRNFLAQLLETAGTGFARGTAQAEASQIRSQEYLAMGAALNWGGEETDALTKAKNLLFTPLIYGASVSLSDTVSFAAQYFVNWIAKLISPTELELVTKLSFQAMGGKKKATTLNDLYFLMEYGVGIGIFGDKYKDVDERMKIKKALNNIRKGLTKGIINVDKHPLMAIELYRLLNICVVTADQQPGVNWYTLYDTVLGDALIAIEKGVIKNEEDMVDFVNVMDFIARKRLYDLGDVAEAIWKAVKEDKYPLDMILKNAVELASKKKKISKKYLRKPKKAKPVFGLKTVPKKGGYYAKKAVPKKKGGKT